MPRLTRRAAIAGTLAAPMLSRRAHAAQQLVVRTTGGVYDDIMRRSFYDDFTKATGIEVVTAGAPMTKLIAMYKAGGAEFDVIDTGDGGLLTLERMGALLPIDYAGWKYGKPDEIIKDLRFPYRVANFVYATVMVYNKDSFATKHPQDWAEFWDTKTFPGPRTLPDMASGQPPLEFALIADGVAPDKLYPIDLTRAFKALTRIRSSVPKFWDTGALSAQLMSDKEVVLGSLWSGRVQAIIDKGAPLGIEWNQNISRCRLWAFRRTPRTRRRRSCSWTSRCRPKVRSATPRTCATVRRTQKATTCCRRICWRSCPAGRNTARSASTRTSTGGRTTATR